MNFRAEAPWVCSSTRRDYCLRQPRNNFNNDIGYDTKLSLFREKQIFQSGFKAANCNELRNERFKLIYEKCHYKFYKTVTRILSGTVIIRW